ncbi:MAG: PfkB family carbohydrate kinase [Lentisphaerota bacterium]
MNKSFLTPIFKAMTGKKIAVIGDLMLDSYIWGKVTRISPEAPVPVVHVRRKTYCLGGAANVMRNISSLGGEAIAFGILGTQSTGNQLLELIKDNKINSNYIAIDKDYLTIEKQRIMAESQQLARVDYEDKETIPDYLHDYITTKIIELINAAKIDAVIFEDYAKGLITSEMMSEILSVANKKGIVTSLDPHPSRRLNFKGITLATPNQNEAFALAGVYNKELIYPPIDDPSLKEVAGILKKEWEVEQLLVTLGAKGMALYEKDKSPLHIPTKAKEVFDVTGAGDTVIATYTLALLGGATGHQAAEISNQAAGIVVGRIGTSSVTQEELLNEFSN